MNHVTGLKQISDSKPMHRIPPVWHRGVCAALALCLGGSGLLYGQGSVDPTVTPRAALMDRAGERGMATEMLGRYLATAPDDGTAWFHLARFYLLDARDWHLQGHTGDPPGPLYLDLAGTAMDEAVRLLVDSGVVYRALVEMERARLFVEAHGWNAARERPRDEPVYLPPFLRELGTNLLSSCPRNGVLVTGGDLEMVAVWYASLEGGHRPDVTPLDPRFYATDSLYRAAIATALGVDPGLPVQQALQQVASRRPVCLAPLADPAAVPFDNFAPRRLVRVSPADAAGEPAPGALSVARLIAVERGRGSVWTTTVRRIYGQAAQFNPLLCQGLFQPLGDRPLGACGR